MPQSIRKAWSFQSAIREKPLDAYFLADDDRYIRVSLKDLEGMVIRMMVPKNQDLAVMMNNYSAHRGAKPGYFRFFFDGDQVNYGQTPEEMGIEDDDAIDVFLEMIGGGSEDDILSA